MLRYAVKINISKHAQSWDLRVDFFKIVVFMKTRFFVAQICDFQNWEKVVISLLPVEFHLKVTGSDEASKIPDSLFICEDINEFASCEERTKSPKNLKIVLFHYSQLDFWVFDASSEAITFKWNSTGSNEITIFLHF